MVQSSVSYFSLAYDPEITPQQVYKKLLCYVPMSILLSFNSCVMGYEIFTTFINDQSL